MNKFKKPTLFKIPKFDLNYLTDIKNEENSCVIAKRTKLHLNFHPLHLTDFMASLKEILNQKITRYSKELGGILLGYDDVKVMSNLGVINDDSCFIHVDIEGNFFIFTPAVGQHLHGTVNKINKSHISCLVYDCFTVTVPLSDDEAWLENELQNGENVLLKIVSVNLRCKLPYIKAQIVSEITNAEDDDNTENIIENNPKEKVKKKIKRKRASVSTDDIEEANVPQEEYVVAHKKKKTCKRQSNGARDE